VLANRPRLKMLGLLVQTGTLTVSAVAERLRLSLPVASQYLRALEARGLLVSRRLGRRVEYRLNVASTMKSARELTAALRLAFQRDPAPVEALFKLATTFTHPRRIEIFRALAAQARTPGQLQAVTRISAPALFRHLQKLEERGFVEGHGGLYAVANWPSGFGGTLARLAAK
jgi:DNA-binding transcriptional ArsR family regulator